MDAQGDEYVCRQIGIHMGMQVTVELVFIQDIGLDDGLFEGQFIVLGLAHQGLGDGRNGSFQLYRTVRPDIGGLGIVQTEDVDPAVVGVDIAGNGSPDYFQAMVIQ